MSKTKHKKEMVALINHVIIRAIDKDRLKTTSEIARASNIIYKKLEEHNKDNIVIPKCDHDYVCIDKWQDAEKTYWEFHCRYCLEIVVRDDKNGRR